MRDFAIELTDRPGELGRVAAALARYNVNLKAVTGLSVGNHVLVRIIADDVEAARAALEGAGIRFTEGEIVQVLLENRAGELARSEAGRRALDGGRRQRTAPTHLREQICRGRVGRVQRQRRPERRNRIVEAALLEMAAAEARPCGLLRRRELDDRRVDASGFFAELAALREIEGAAFQFCEGHGR